MHARIPFVALSLVVFTTTAPAEDWPGWRGPRAGRHRDRHRLPARPWSDTRERAGGSRTARHRALVAGRQQGEGVRHRLHRGGEEAGAVLRGPRDRQDPVGADVRRLRPGEEARREQLGQLHPGGRRRAGVHHVPRQARSSGSSATTTPATWCGRRRPASSTRSTASAARRCSTRIWSSSTATRTPRRETAYIVALDKKTGEERWRADRPNKLRSYCPPVVVDAAGKKQLVLTGSKCVASYDPDTGKQHWIIDGPTEQFVSSMVLHDGVLLMTAGFPEHWVMAIDPSRQRERDEDARPVVEEERGRLRPVARWRTPASCSWWTTTGVASCWDVKTGKQYWKERLSGKGTTPRRSRPTAASTSPPTTGVTFVVKAARRVRGAGEEPARRAGVRLAGVLRRRHLHPRGEAPVVHRREEVDVVALGTRRVADGIRDRLRRGARCDTVRGKEARHVACR